MFFPPQNQQKKKASDAEDDEATVKMPTTLGKRPKRTKRAAHGGDDPDVIPFLASTRFKRGDALTSAGSGSMLLTLAKKAGKALVQTSAFKFVAEEKIFETVVGMLAYRVAFQWSKDPTATRKARLLFTLYICLYLGALIYCRNQALVLQDTRTLKVAAMPAMLGSLLEAAKKLKKGEGMGGLAGGLPGFAGQEKELTFKEYDLAQVKSSLDRFTMFLIGMTFLHFKMKNVYMIMYWGTSSFCVCVCGFSYPPTILLVHACVVENREQPMQ